MQRLILVLTLLLIFPVSVQAQANPPVRLERGNNQQVRQAPAADQVSQEERTTQRQETAVTRCERIQEQLVLKAEEFALRQQKHADRYTHVQSVLSTIISRLETAGIDSSGLEQVLAGFTASIRLYESQSASLIEQFEAAQAIDCGGDLQQVRTQLQQIRSELAELKETLQEILAHKDALHTELQALKEQATE